MSPDKYDDWEDFVKFVTTELGDIPVLDNGRFISQKIGNYWKCWRFAKALPKSSSEPVQTIRSIYEI